MLEKLIPFGYLSLADGLDILITGLYCSRKGTQDEFNKLTKGLMDAYGVTKGLLKKGLIDQTILLSIGGVAYLCDKIIGIENEPMNFHKVWLYGVGSGLYIAALNNSVFYAISLIKKDELAHPLIEINTQKEGFRS